MTDTSFYVRSAIEFVELYRRGVPISLRGAQGARFPQRGVSNIARVFCGSQIPYDTGSESLGLRLLEVAACLHSHVHRLKRQLQVILRPQRLGGKVRSMQLPTQCRSCISEISYPHQRCKKLFQVHKMFRVETECNNLIYNLSQCLKW